MAQHSNYAQDRDLMMEAYGSVSGIVPKTSTTAMPRGYVLTEGHCSDEETTESVELGGKLYEVGNDDPNDDGLVIKIEKHPNGYFITGGVYSEPEDFVNDPENPREGYGYALTLDGQPMDEDDLEDGLGHSEDGEHVPAEDSSCASDEEHGEGTVTVELELDASTAEKLHSQLMDEVVPAEDSSCNSEHEEHEDAETRLGATNEFPDGEGKYEVVDVGGMHGQSKMGGKKFNSLADACAHAGCDPSEITSEEWIDMEGDGTTLEFMVDEDTAIVMHKNVPAEDGEHAKGKHDDGDDKDERCDYVPCEDEEEVVAESYTSAYLDRMD